jgi:release factor glutamine methyltransferase
MTLAEAEKNFISQLAPLYDKEEAKELAFYVFHQLSGISKSDFFLKRDHRISDKDESSSILVLEELKTGKPVQYIFGETVFYGLPLKVNPSVLIPRPETEELVEWVLKEVGGRKTEDGRRKTEGRSRRSEVGGQNPKSKIRNILDIGTGSGCIAIALKRHLPEAKVYGLDISPDALEIVRQNALLNNTRIEFLNADILKNTNPLPNIKFSIIVSNPPYITSAEKQQMHINTIKYEPHSALFVPDKDPLIFYKHIIDFARIHLLAGGLLFFEINENLGAQITDLLDQKGFSDIALRQDMQGKDRMIKAKL